MRVLVTGATGFLGGALVKSLIGKGQEVRVLVRKTSKLRALETLPVDIRYGCLEDKTTLASLLKNIDVVYHCAALSSDWAPWEEFYQANVLGVRNLLERVVEAGEVQRFVHISTTDVYGYPVQACEETYPITDVGLPYNRSKGLGEKIVWEFHRTGGVPVTLNLPATIYGPRSISIVVEIAALLLQKQMVLINGGRSPAGLLYIDNAVDAIIQASLSPHTNGQAYNLRDESNETWSQFVEVLAQGLGTRYPWIKLPSKLALGIGYLCEIAYRTAGIRSRPLLTRHAVYLLFRDQGYPIRKAQKDFGFLSRVTFAEGIKETLSWLASDEGQEALRKKK